MTTTSNLMRKLNMTYITSIEMNVYCIELNQYKNGSINMLKVAEHKQTQVVIELYDKSARQPHFIKKLK